MAITVNIHEAKTHLSRLLERVLNGEQIIIAKAGKPIAILTPYTQNIGRRVPGNDGDTVVIAPNFDETLPEFDE